MSQWGRIWGHCLLQWARFLCLYERNSPGASLNQKGFLLAHMACKFQVCWLQAWLYPAAHMLSHPAHGWVGFFSASILCWQLLSPAWKHSGRESPFSLIALAKVSGFTLLGPTWILALAQAVLTTWGALLSSVYPKPTYPSSPAWAP